MKSLGRFLSWTLVGILVLTGRACYHSTEGLPDIGLVVENRSTMYSVRGVYIMTARNGTAWGVNLLTSDIGPGDIRTFELLPDTYNIRIESDHPLAPLYIMNAVVSQGRPIVVTMSDQTIDWE